MTEDHRPEPPGTGDLMGVAHVRTTAEGAAYLLTELADDEPDTAPWCVILMDPRHGQNLHAWLVPEGQAVAEEFARFVTAEIDPAVAMRLDSAAGELMRWRTAIAQPAFKRLADARAVAERWRDDDYAAPAARAMLDTLDGL